MLDEGGLQALTEFLLVQHVSDFLSFVLVQPLQTADARVSLGLLLRVAVAARHDLALVVDYFNLLESVHPGSILPQELWHVNIDRSLVAELRLDIKLDCQLLEVFLGLFKHVFRVLCHKEHEGRQQRSEHLDYALDAAVDENRPDDGFKNVAENLRGLIKLNVVLRHVEIPDEAVVNILVRIVELRLA